MGGASLCKPRLAFSWTQTSFTHKTQKSVTHRVNTQEPRADAPTRSLPHFHARVYAFECVCGARSVIFDLSSVCVRVFVSVWVCESCSHGCGRNRSARAAVWANFGECFSLSLFCSRAWHRDQPYLPDFDLGYQFSSAVESCQSCLCDSWAAQECVFLSVFTSCLSWVTIMIHKPWHDELESETFLSISVFLSLHASFSLSLSLFFSGPYNIILTELYIYIKVCVPSYLCICLSRPWFCSISLFLSVCLHQSSSWVCLKSCLYWIWH